MMRPSCGKRFSAMSSFAIIFKRLVIASFRRRGRGHHRGELTVNAEPHAHLEFVRLDMNIAGSALHGIRQDQVDEFDDRSFFRGLFQGRESISDSSLSASSSSLSSSTRSFIKFAEVPRGSMAEPP